MTPSPLQIQTTKIYFQTNEELNSDNYVNHFRRTDDALYLIGNLKTLSSFTAAMMRFFPDSRSERLVHTLYQR
ncbi:hypothetical protein RO3G_06758 [Rhizopus delemar RA 99-880]|uniref:Uncharacterized protein n=1 Tax=Rhizopus delemar (strain RA 99-880 / ATCC MYA-4621 / FGSC 9543 / NRRL 43880) TaxID=246409 RepID=I1C0S3_RHIO9|nr:hypothetical protein RO3G_06758 [Rhizopus delemar RA 99-880]|eukprot:EIE82053.1 hypothetical protein RO3G_06758 [Rhizopus delemar RA 99-880]